ncbi:chromosome segregation protein [Candidatus Nitrosocosmicus oleophilus]|uniref:Chromosome segregation protein n=1 Tax=Candidatus Nitrosocosmicus oleophilus TaxID=1353260 RepID=A0A654M1M4_9ARCH|nr:AAA family ATPase [Candidatus Nitrosocosmicus oleophilus]ALI36860.1 chromosome segregation protein [Candidatus Nitrosocosmicus oleophilus]
MKPVSLYLSNFKSFLDIKLNFRDDLQLICGKNNTGKSTILEAISLLLQKPLDDAQLRDKINVFQKKNTFEIVLKVKIEENDIYPIIKNAKVSNIRLSRSSKDEIYNMQNKEITISLSYDRIMDNYTKNISYFSKNTQEEIIEVKCSVEDYLAKKFLYINSDRTVLPSEYFTPKNNFDKNFISQNHNVRHYILYLKTYRPDQFVKFQSAISQIFENMLVKPRINYEEGFVTVEVNLNGPSTEIGLIGAGQKELLLILSKIFYYSPDLVMIDEPELNLHYDLIIKFLNFMKNHNSLFVLSSHSDLLINNVNLDQLIYTKPQNNFISSISKIDREGLSELYEDLGYIQSNYEKLRNLDYDMMILYEGKDSKEKEKKVINKFLSESKNSNTLSKVRKKYIPLGGRKDKILHNILDGVYDIKFPFILILDRDEVNEKDVEKYNQTYETRIHIWGKREIENYLINIRAIVKVLRLKGIETDPQTIHKVVEDLSLKLLNKVAILRVIERYKRKTLIEDHQRISKFISENQGKNTLDIASNLGDFVLQGLQDLNKNNIENEFNNQILELKNRWKKDFLTICPGKELLALLKNYINKTYHVTVHDFEILDEIEILDDDIETLSSKIVKQIDSMETHQNESESNKFIKIGTWNWPVLFELTASEEIVVIMPNLEYDWNNTNYEIKVFKEGNVRSTSILTTNLIPYDLAIIERKVYILCSKVLVEDDREFEYDTLLIYDIESQNLDKEVHFYYEEEEGKEGDPSCIAINKITKKVYASIFYYEGGNPGLFSLEPPYINSKQISDGEVGYFDLLVDEKNNRLFGIFYENPKYFLHVYDTENDVIIYDYEIEASTSSELVLKNDNEILIQNQNSLLRLEVASGLTEILLECNTFEAVRFDPLNEIVYVISHDSNSEVFSLNLWDPQSMIPILCSKFRISDLRISAQQICYLLSVPDGEKQNKFVYTIKQSSVQSILREKTEGALFS